MSVIHCSIIFSQFIFYHISTTRNNNSTTRLHIQSQPTPTRFTLFQIGSAWTWPRKYFLYYNYNIQTYTYIYKNKVWSGYIRFSFSHFKFSSYQHSFYTHSLLSKLSLITHTMIKLKYKGGKSDAQAVCDGIR